MRSGYMLLLGACVWPALAQLGPAGDFVPPTERLNGRLPVQLRFWGEERARLEYSSGLSLAPDSYFFNRLRLNMDASPAPWLKFTLQLQDARVMGQQSRPGPIQRDTADLRVGYVQLGGDEARVRLRLGRQSLDFGDGRLIADPNWSNTGRTFDAVRLTLQQGRNKLDLMSGATVRVAPDEFDRPADGQHVHGLYGSLGSVVKNAVVEPYLLWRMEHNYRGETGTIGHFNSKTVGVRWAGKFMGRFDYNSEVAVQGGRACQEQMRTWLGHWLLGRTLTDGQRRPRLFAEFNYASGDSSVGDGRRGTFDFLFPSVHDKFGLADLFAASNIEHFRTGFQFAAHRNFQVAGEYSQVWLANAGDALYAGGRAWRGVRTERHVGQEAGVQVVWTASRSTQLTTGVSRLFPGGYLSGVPGAGRFTMLYLNLAQRF